MNATLHLLNPESSADIDLCFEVFNVLRPQLDRAEFQRRLQIQQGEGFRIVFLLQGARAVAAAGFRVAHYLAWGRVLYVDDLITLPEMKRAGLGGQLMDWLTDEAKRQACDELHLDTGYQRHDAHRLYLRKGLQFTCHHAAMELKR